MNQPYFKQDTQPRPPDLPPPGMNDGHSRRKLPKLTLVKYGATAVAALLVGVAIGMSGESALTEELEQVKADSQRSLAAAAQSAEEEIDALEAELADKDQEIEEAISRAEDAEGRVDDRLAELEGLEADLRERRSKLDQRQKQLDDREREITSTENQIADNTIIDGIWQVGTDFAPGTYRASGGGLCYWARLGSADNYDIISNGLGKNPTVTLNAGEWFETSDCGDWTLIGG
jgi:hypothetical protein